MRTPLISIAMTATLAMACASSTGSGSSGSDPSNPQPGGSDPKTEEEGQGQAPKCATDAPRYYAFLKTGSCRDVVGANGRWTASPLFPTAPEVVRDAACSFRWTGSITTPNAEPDVDALSGLGAEHLTKGVDAQEKTSCAAPVFSPEALTMVPANTNDASAPTGVTGCDVCGRVAQDHVYVILPADKLDLRTLVLVTGGSKFVTFEVGPSSGGAQVFAVELPPAPDGTNYKEGRITMLEKAY